MNTKRIFLAAVAIWIFGTVWTMSTCAGLFSWVYTLPPIIWKTPAEMMTTGNMILSSVVGFLTSVIFVAVYALLYKGIPNKGVKKGMIYGFLVWLICAFSGIIPMPFYMTINTTVVIYWVTSFFVSYLIMGAIVGAIYKEK